MTEPLDDPMIRVALRALVSASDPSAQLFDEFPLCRRDSRADVLAVNGHLSGYEIKSDLDSLARLPRQVEAYETICDFCFVVVGPKYLRKIRTHVPRTWGIYLAFNTDTLEPVRKARRNTRVQSTSLARVLWKPEVIRCLRMNGIPANPNRSVSDLWELLDQLPKALIAETVRRALKARAGQQCIPGDDS